MSWAGLIPALREGNGTGSSASKVGGTFGKLQISSAGHTYGQVELTGVLVPPNQSFGGDHWYITHCLDSYTCMLTMGTL
jgi:hypothetical protein